MSEWYEPAGLFEHVQDVDDDIVNRYVNSINAANMAATWIVGENAHLWKQETGGEWQELADQCSGFSASSLNSRAIIWHRFAEVAEDLPRCSFGHFRSAISLPQEEALQFLYWVNRAQVSTREAERAVNMIKRDGFESAARALGLETQFVPAVPETQQPHSGKQRGPKPAPPPPAPPPPPPGGVIPLTKPRQTAEHRHEDHRMPIGNDVLMPENVDDPGVLLQQHVEAILALDFEESVGKKAAKTLRETADLLDPPQGKRKVATMDQVNSVARLWNALDGVRHMATMTAHRIKQVRARLAEDFFAANYRDAMNKVMQSPGLLGNNNRKWVADFDWFIRPNTVPAIMEGKYDNWGADVSGDEWGKVFGDEHS